jgi:hypothetical protein
MIIYIYIYIYVHWTIRRQCYPMILIRLFFAGTRFPSFPVIAFFDCFHFQIIIFTSPHPIQQTWIIALNLCPHRRTCMRFSISYSVFNAISCYTIIVCIKCNITTALVIKSKYFYILLTLWFTKSFYDRRASSLWKGFAYYACSRFETDLGPFHRIWTNDGAS